MRLPKRGEKGFTLIELLIVVAILGVLAAVVIPNVTRFVGAGEQEAAETELHNIQLAVTSMMLENGITSIPNVLGVATDNMSAFPDTSSVIANDDKVTDPEGFPYDFTGGAPNDAPGYVLYGHDITGQLNPNQGTDVNYVTVSMTAHSYLCAADGTVTQQ